MKYTLVDEKENIILGPIEWDVFAFQQVLNSNGFNISISPIEATSVMSFGEAFKIYPTDTTYIIPKEYQRKINNFSIKKGKGVYIESVINLEGKELEDILMLKKGKMIAELSSTRKFHQYSPINIGDFILSADLNSQTAMNIAINSMDDINTINWKDSYGKWYEMSKKDLSKYILIINERTQKLFNKEKEMNDIIEGFTVSDMVNELMILDWSI